MMDILTHDTNFWLGISFAIFAFIVWKKGKAGFLNMIDTRIANIRKDIETADSLRAEAERLLNDYTQKHLDAVKESQGIIANAEKQAVIARKQAEEDLAELINRREKQLQERLDRMKQSAISEIQQYATDLAIAATSEIITSRLDKKAADQLIDKSIKGVALNLN